MSTENPIVFQKFLIFNVDYGQLAQLEEVSSENRNNLFKRTEEITNESNSHLKKTTVFFLLSSLPSLEQWFPLFISCTGLYTDDGVFVQFIQISRAHIGTGTAHTCGDFVDNIFRTFFALFYV